MITQYSFCATYSEPLDWVKSCLLNGVKIISISLFSGSAANQGFGLELVYKGGAGKQWEELCVRALSGEGWRERQDLLANTSRYSLQVTSLPVGLYIKTI